MESLTQQAANVGTARFTSNCKTLDGIWTMLKDDENVPSQRSLHVGVVLDNCLFIFGGYDGTQRTNDFYKYDFISCKWMQINSNNSPPSPRDRHTAVIYDRCIYIFGGFDGVNRVNDFYSYNLSKNSWSEVIHKGSSLPPTPRHSHSACIYQKYMYVFSGYDGLYKNDLYKFSFETSEWSSIKDSNPSAENWPKPRYRTSLTVHRDKIYMFGGHDGTRQLNDFFGFDPKTENWEQITLLDFVPSPRDSHVAVTFGNSLFIFGGSTGATVTNSRNDFFEFSFDDYKWYQLYCENGYMPPSRFCHVGALQNKKLYIFGGYDGVNRLNDFFEYDFENDSLHSESTLTNDLAGLVNNPTFSDIKFILEKDRVLYAHRVLLIRIPYFSGMLLSNMKESKQSQIKIENISYYIFHQLLIYIYTDKVEVEGIDSMIELFEAADLYGIERLKAICEKKIYNLLNAENCALILTSADKRSAHKLREYAINFIIKNFDVVSKTPQFENLMRKDLELGLEILKRR